MIIGIDMGHTLTGKGTGAVGVVKETDKNREAGKRLISMLTAKGHTVVNCTVDKSSNDLSDRVKLANKQPLDLFVSLHLNAGGGQGVETYVYSTSSKAYSYAKSIQEELVKNVEWRNRGVKTASFYVIKNTNAPALLVELGFCDSQVDMNKWNTEKIALSLFKGITGVNYSEEEVKQVTQQPPVVNTPTPTPDVDPVYEKAKNYNAARCRELQEKLNKCGYNCGTVDGIYGYNTHKALGELQSKNGLVVDYLAGNATFAKLDKLIAKQTASQGDPWIKRLQEECNKQGFSKQKVDGFAGSFIERNIV